MDKEIRNILQRATQDARRLLEEEYREQLEGIFDILLDGTIGQEAGPHLDATQRLTRQKLVAAIEHNRASGIASAEAVAMYLREAAFTTLNRFAALKMLEARGLVQECISKGEQSAGFKEFSGLAPGLAYLPDKGYRLYIENIFDEIGREVRVLFNRHDSASQLWPRRHAFGALLDLLNQQDLIPVWAEDEAIGWIYQYFNSQDERREMRKFPAPRNSRELAIRNQFFTPRYVVEFLTDNTLGRIWYEMRQGDTALKEKCRYLVRRPNEVFLQEGEAPPDIGGPTEENLTQEELLLPPVYIGFRPKKDPREIRMLDPAGGSGHFGLYCFDLFLVLYAEAYEDPKLGLVLQQDYPDRAAFMAAVPQLILEHNIHIIDIDPRATQIAGLALWMRAQRAFNDINLTRAQRQPVTRTNVVCAEPMPGEKDMLREFSESVKPSVLGQLINVVFDRMKLAGEAGSLLRIDEEIKNIVAVEKSKWIKAAEPEQQFLFSELISPKEKNMEMQIDVDELTNERFWDKAEHCILSTLHAYAKNTERGRNDRHRLFADDASRGFAFIDLCRKRYDVVVMNPPFGLPSSKLKEYASKCYPAAWTDLFNSFLARASTLLKPGGAMGAIVPDRVLVSKKSLAIRRQLKDSMGLHLVVNLGPDVMDRAAVSAVLLVSGSAQLCRVAQVADLSHGNIALREKLLLSWSRNPGAPMNLHIFENIPGVPLAISVPSQVLSVWKRKERLDPDWATVATGGKTFDDTRFLRAWWEVPQHELDIKWKAVDVGGDHQPGISPPRMVQNWGGAEPKSGLMLSNCWALMRRSCKVANTGFGHRFHTHIQAVSALGLVSFTIILFCPLML